MANIIMIDSKTLVNKFLKEYDYRKFQFALISDNVKTKDKYENINSLPILLPPPYIISEFVNDKKNEYSNLYGQYLQNPKVELSIVAIVKLALVYGEDIVLVCSPTEQEYSYMDIISDFIDKVYGIHTCNYKEFRKRKVSNTICKNSKMEKRIELLETRLKHLTKQVKKETNETVKKLKKESKSNLIRYCKSGNIPVKKKWSRDKIISCIVERLI